MARQKGIIKLDGTIGGITFYKSQDGYLAREKERRTTGVYVVMREHNFVFLVLKSYDLIS